MAPAANSNEPPAANEPAPSKRRRPRAHHSTMAFVQRLDPPDASALRVNHVDRSAEGLAINAMIPLAIGARIVINTTDASPRQVLLLGHVVHCTKLNTGRFQIGVAVLDQREGNLHTTKIPDAWCPA
jgi:hypothetical protein